MSETPNYGLYLEDDASARFQDWREKINGTDNSNMVKIDTALGTMAQKSGKVTGTLLASAWSGIDSPFTQTLAVEGLGAETEIFRWRKMQRLNNGTQHVWRCFLSLDRAKDSLLSPLMVKCQT